MAWLIILATIPVGLVGLAFEHAFRVIFGKPVLAACSSLPGRQRRDPDRGGALPDPGVAGRDAALREARARAAAATAPAQPLHPVPAAPGGMPAAPPRYERDDPDGAVQADRRLATMGYPRALVIGSAQVLALLAGISRDGAAMVAGMARGLSREDAARFAFLLATPVILAAGVLEVPDLAGPIGRRDPRPDPVRQRTVRRRRLPVRSVSCSATCGPGR